MLQGPRPGAGGFVAEAARQTLSDEWARRYRDVILCHVSGERVIVRPVYHRRRNRPV